MRPSRTASTASRAGSSVGRSSDRGHHAPSTYPVVGAFGFNFSRSVCRDGSVAMVAGGVMMRRCGSDLMSVSRPRSENRPVWVAVEYDVNLTVHVRDVLDNPNTTPK